MRGGHRWNAFARMCTGPGLAFNGVEKEISKATKASQKGCQKEAKRKSKASKGSQKGIKMEAKTMQGLPCGQGLKKY